jgi:intracellular multiplication protein IcmD
MNKKVNKEVLKSAILAVAAFACIGLATSVFAINGSGVAGVANAVKSNLASIAQLITAIAYVAGMAFGVGAIVKFKAHKDNPTQVPVGLPIVLLFVAGALLFVPSIFKTAATTLYKSGTAGSVSGVSSFS